MPARTNPNPAMQLARDEQDILGGRQGPVLQKATSVLVRFGEALGARRLVPIQSAHLVVAGAFILFLRYMRFLREVAAGGLKVRVPTTINSRPFDPGDASLLGRIIFIRQRELEGLYSRLGCEPTYTCTPYFDANAPSVGDAIAWAESSAVAYANSVIGARTNPTPAMIDVCSALLGRTPEYGLLLEENRRGTHRISIEAGGKIDYGVLGHVIAQRLVTGVPVIDGIQPTPHELKTLGASLGAAGAVALFHVLDVTPEARALGRDILRAGHQRLTITEADLQAASRSLRTDTGSFSHIIIGCPHLSLDELQSVGAVLCGAGCQPADRKPTDGRRPRLWLLACERVREQVAGTDTGRFLLDAGAELKSLCPIYFHDTPRLFGKRILTNSVKLAHHTGSAWAPLAECLALWGRGCRLPWCFAVDRELPTGNC